MNEENGLLRAKVQRLQVEVQEYRKRLSLNGMRSMPSSRTSSLGTNNNIANAKLTNFQFEFPRFGDPLSEQFIQNDMTADIHNLSSPLVNKLSNQSSIPGVLSRPNANPRSVSVHEGLISPGLSVEFPIQDSPLSLTKTNSSSIAATDQGTNASSAEGNMISPTRSETTKEPGDSDKPQGSVSSVATNQNRVFKFNSGAANSVTNSPSTSPWSQFGPSSSAGTSPEPGHDSPYNSKTKDDQPRSIGVDVLDANKQAEDNSLPQNIPYATPQTESPFNINPFNPVQLATTTHPTTNTDTHFSSTTVEPKGFDWLANESSSGQFDPVLFGQYRESQDAIVGNGDFTNGFFDDALPFGTGSPLGIDSSILATIPGLNEADQASVLDTNFNGFGEQQLQNQDQTDGGQKSTGNMLPADEDEMAKCKEMLMYVGNFSLFLFVALLRLSHACMCSIKYDYCANHFLHRKQGENETSTTSS